MPNYPFMPPAMNEDNDPYKISSFISFACQSGGIGSVVKMWTSLNSILSHLMNHETQFCISPFVVEILYLQMNSAFGLAGKLFPASAAPWCPNKRV